MQHLTEEQLIAHYYHDADGASAEEHLTSCDECRAHRDACDRARRSAPHPSEATRMPRDRTRLRWNSAANAAHASIAAIAAALALAFVGGVPWQPGHSSVPALRSLPPPASRHRRPSFGIQNRLLLVVVSDSTVRTDAVELQRRRKHPLMSPRRANAPGVWCTNRFPADGRARARRVSLRSRPEPVLVEFARRLDSRPTKWPSAEVL
jgi:hypothetical protein